MILETDITLNLTSEPEFLEEILLWLDEKNIECLIALGDDPLNDEFRPRSVLESLLFLKVKIKSFKPQPIHFRILNPEQRTLFKLTWC